MGDQNLDILRSNFVDVFTISSHDPEVYEHEMVEIQKQGSHLRDAGKPDGNRELEGSDGETNTTEPVLACHEQALRLKIEDVSNKVEIISKEKELLCNEVMSFTADNLLSLETLDALQKIGTENELFKTNCLEGIEILKMKCLEECLETEKPYNEVTERRGNISVFCRCRPLTQDEVVNGASSVVDFDSCQENELRVVSADSTRWKYKFDHVFRPEDDQEAIFVQTQPIVTSVLDGYNVCIFAYGQTGTGKTYTMDGTPENRGVIYRTLEELFRLSQESSSIMRHELFVSMLEVYNEKIRDLLVENQDQHSKKLEIKQSAEGTQEVPGLVESRVYGTGDVWDLLKKGSRARSVGSTSGNESSSCSHSLLRVTVMGENLLNGQRTKSTLWLVDLAGSERLSRTEVEGEKLKESHKSLSAIVDVISSLTSRNVPYRSLKLTHMLQSLLGGDCRTLMFVQISPNSADLDETLDSLSFATRVRVQHGPARRQTDNSELLKYKQLAEKAKEDEKETWKLQDSLQSMQLKMAFRENMCRNLQGKRREVLPDAVVQDILSLMNNDKDVASCNCVSEKWKELMPYSRRLFFPRSLFDNLTSGCTPDAIVTQMVSMIEKLEELVVYCSFTSTGLASWLAISGFSLRSLELCLDNMVEHQGSSEIPSKLDCIRAAPNLESLKLCRVLMVSSPKWDVFDRLNTLEIVEARLEEYALSDALRSCPNLTHLLLLGCKGLRSVVIDSPHLQDCTLEFIPGNCLLTVKSSKLQSLEVGGCSVLRVPETRFLQNLSIFNNSGIVSLVDCGKLVTLRKLSMRGVQWCWDAVSNMLQMASEVQDLYMKVEFDGHTQSPEVDFIDFFNSHPKLQTFDIHGAMFAALCQKKSLKNVDSAFSIPCLEKVTVTARPLNAEMCTLDSFLKYAKNLQKLTIKIQQMKISHSSAVVFFEDIWKLKCMNPEIVSIE